MIATPGALRLLLELGLFAAVTVWLVIGEGYVLAVVLAAGTVIHYASWPARIRWLMAH